MHGSTGLALSWSSEATYTFTSFPAHPWNCIAQFQLGIDFCVVVCHETAASWQHAIDYNTSTAALSTLGATPAAQESGGQILPQQTRKTGTAEAQSLQHIISHPADSCAFSSCSAFKHASLSQMWSLPSLLDHFIQKLRGIINLLGSSLMHSFSTLQHSALT